jgi:signal transduction histidine kinase
MQLATLRQLLGEQGLDAQLMDDAGRMVEEMSGALRAAVQVMRSLSVSLSPPVLHDEGLYEAVRWLASLMQQQHGLAVAVTAEGPLPPLDEDLRVLIFQTIRELLFNVAKHAGVAEAAVALAAAEGQLRVEVSDAGRGFDPAAPAKANAEAGGAAGTDPGSQGLLWAQRRLQLLGGRVEVQSQPGEGTRVTIVVPVAA